MERKWYGVAVKGLVLTMALLSLVANALGAEFVVIANRGVSAGSLGKSDLEAMFLGEKTKWYDGKPVRIAVLEEGDAHKAFLQTVVGKTPSQFGNHWKKQVFTGKAAAPKTFGDGSALLEYVAATPGAIGYVGAGKAGSSVKTISVR